MKKYLGNASSKLLVTTLLFYHSCVLHASSLMELDVSYNKLSFVPSSLFKMPELVVLNLSFNLLRTLPGDHEDPSAATPGGMVKIPLTQHIYSHICVVICRSVILCGSVGS